MTSKKYENQRDKLIALFQLNAHGNPEFLETLIKEDSVKINSLDPSSKDPELDKKISIDYHFLFKESKETGNLDDGVAQAIVLNEVLGDYKFPEPGKGYSLGTSKKFDEYLLNIESLAMSQDIAVTMKVVKFKEVMKFMVQGSKNSKVMVEELVRLEKRFSDYKKQVIDLISNEEHYATIKASYEQAFESLYRINSFWNNYCSKAKSS